MSLFGRSYSKKDEATKKSAAAAAASRAAASSYDEDMDLSAAKTAIRDKQMSDWSHTEVLGWLETIDLHEHKSSFFENKISGAELPTLTEDDMKALGITKIGQRKKLAKEISKASSAERVSGSQSASHTRSTRTDKDDDGSEDSGSKDSSANSAQVTIKLVYGKDIRAIRIPMDMKYSELRHAVKEQYGQRMRMKYKDEDGDYVSIRRQQDLIDMFSDMQMDNRTRQRIFVTPSKESENVRDKEDSAKAMAVFQMFDVLLDALIAISDEGIVQYCNPAFEKLTGWTSKELISKNITTIMTEEYKRTHDAYLKTYLKTRTSKIIGVGRDVVYQKKDGSVGTVHLEVTEKLIGDRSYFFGTLKKPVDKVMKSILQMEREVLDRLVVPAIIIDHKGTIHGFNNAASSLLGYQLVDVVGRNINLLMTGMDKQNHDTYLKRYIETGKSKIIGVGRKVVAQTKDGALKPVMLSITEKIDGDTRFFTGILQDPNAS